MKHLNSFSDIDSIKAFDEQTDNLLSLSEPDDSKFMECFTKIFTQNNTIDIDSDNESEFYIKEKSSLQTISNNSCQNKDNTLDKSKAKNQKNEIEEDLSSFIASDKSIVFCQNLPENKSMANSLQENIDLAIDQIKKDETEAKSETFLGKKRHLFKIDYPKNFGIFSCGDFNKYSRQIIDEVMEEFEQNDSNESGDEPLPKLGSKKKSCKKIQNVQKRKENADNIRKKIKSRFLKVLKNTVNERLKAAGSQKLFKFLPQRFICNVSKEKNKAVLNLSFKELFSKNFCEEEKGNEADLANYYHNLSVLDYLEKNKEISENSNFNVFKDMKYYKIYNEYLKSKEFEMEIASLKKEKENDKYIKNYIIKASDLIEFFSN